MHYQHFDPGGRLPMAFLVARYVIQDFVLYGVIPPPPGFEWVRFGPDLLLVDVSSGDIADSSYGVFEDDGSDTPPPGPDQQDGAPPDPQAGQPDAPPPQQ